MATTGRSTELRNAERVGQLQTDEYYQFPLRTDRNPAKAGKYAKDSDEEAEIEQFFIDNSNLKEMYAQMGHDERSALRSYVAGHYMNKEVFKPFSQMSPNKQRQTQTLQEFLNKSVINKAIQVNRTGGFHLFNEDGRNHVLSLEQMQALKGKLIRSDSFISAGAAPHGISQHVDDLEIEMNIPANSQGAGMYLMGKQYDLKGMAGEREFLGNRYSWWRIGDTKYDKTLNRLRVSIYYEGLDENQYV